MYNIHSHYENILSLVNKNNIDSPAVGYLFPFGSTKIDNIEFLKNPDSDSDPKIIFFCYDQEPLFYSYNKKIFDQFKDLIPYKKIQSIPQKNYAYSETFKSKVLISEITKLIKINAPVILLNTEKNSEEKNKIFNEYNFIDCYYFFHGFAAADWYRGYEYCSDILPIKKRKINKKFISFNRITGNSRVYRSFFVAELVKKNLIEQGHISYSKTCPVHGSLEKELLNAKSKYNLSAEYIKEVLYLLNVKLDRDLRIDTAQDLPIANDSFTIGPIQQSIESFLHIVTETCFWDKKQHLTEKIFKPIVLKQPFVLLGCVNNLSYLKEYGFKTFDKWWDESYDQCNDPIERINMVTKIIEDICKRPCHELENTLLEMEEILEYNYNRFYSKEFVQDIWKELKTNLQFAVAQLPPQTSAKT
jgi:hypothetical protein